MTPQGAPFHADIAGGPDGGAAWWARTSDGVRIRVALWPCENAKGTVLLFPGRTEYIEKYGHTAGELAEIGYATLAVDWRGQGLADRLIDDARVGHVADFTDYQKDVTAALDVARAAGAPEPWYLLGHSMGGAIGLRAAIEGLPVAACAFTGPMWGIYMSALTRPFGWALPRIAQAMGMGTKLAPSTTYDSYVLANPFEDNVLTNDPQMYGMMRDQLEARPELALGGPSLIWLRQGLTECRALAAMESPPLPCVTFLGAEEKIVDTRAVHDRMRRWPGGVLNVVPGAEHEVLMETPDIRARVIEQMDAVFCGDAGRAAAAG